MGDKDAMSEYDPAWIRTALVGRTILRVSPESAVNEDDFADSIMLELDNGMQFTVYPNEATGIGFSMVHRDNA